MSEIEDAIRLANRVLDKPYIDPDGDICLLARQFLRAIEAKHAAWCEGRDAAAKEAKLWMNRMCHSDFESNIRRLKSPYEPQP